MFALAIATLTILARTSVLAERCGNRLITLTSSNKSIEPLEIFIKPYSCPAPGIPSHWTKCCEPPSYNCCKVSRRGGNKFFEIDQSAGVIFAIGAIVLCISAVLVSILCCFWKSCPLYTVCRKEAKPSYTASNNDTMYSSTPTDEEEEKVYAVGEKMRFA